MRLRTLVLAVVMLGVLLASPAAAQTVGPPQPPDAFLASSSGEVKAEIQNYCWRENSPDGTFVGVCADRFDPIVPSQTLVVDQNELVTLRFDRPIRPTSITVHSRATSASAPIESFDVPADNPTQFRIPFPPGSYIVTVGTGWAQGDAVYVFGVTVRAPAFTGVVIPAEFFNAVARLVDAARGLAGQNGLGPQGFAAFQAAFAEVDAMVRSLPTAVSADVQRQLAALMASLASAST